MECYKHTENSAVAQCNECGRGLCETCAEKITPPLCPDCARAYAGSVKAEMLKNIAISVVLMLIGIFVIRSPMGALLAGIPYGWAILNSVTPSMFLWLSWIGWIVYFLIKLVIAYVVGVPALIFKLIRWCSELARVNALLKSADGED